MPALTFGRNLVPILFLTLRLEERVVEGTCWIVARKLLSLTLMCSAVECEAEKG